MKIKGEYRDVVTKNNEIIEDRGWKSNNISKDLGKLIAAMMRNKDFMSKGITHMAVGSSSTAENSETGANAFYKRIRDNVFPSLDFEKPKFDHNNDHDWAWAKKIEDINFLNEEDDQSTVITNKLQINVIFEQDENDLSGRALEFKEFSLLGIGAYNGTEDIFFINYVAHPPISIIFQKNVDNNNTDFTRTVRLTFPHE